MDFSDQVRFGMQVFAEEDCKAFEESARVWAEQVMQPVLPAEMFASFRQLPTQAKVFGVMFFAHIGEDPAVKQKASDIYATLTKGDKNE